MSKQQNDSSATQETSAPRLVGKETMERHQEEQAKAIGCNESKKVSGFEYLLIFTRALVKEGLLPIEALPTAASMARGMKANNSALRQWLYEREEKAATKQSAVADKYLNMG